MDNRGTFWKIYMLFFIVPFPMFIYYMINGFGPNRFGKLSNPHLALVYLGVSLLLWGMVFWGLAKGWKIFKKEAGRNFPKIAGWLLLIASVLGYYVFSYQLESNGTGWRFLRFWHPLLMIPAWAVFFILVIKAALKMAGVNFALQKELQEKGVKTTAKVLRTEQTGVYLNRQPQVLFELEFTDQQGKTHHASHKKIIPFLNLYLAKQSELPITYLPADPQKLRIDA